MSSKITNNTFIYPADTQRGRTLKRTFSERKLDLPSFNRNHKRKRADQGSPPNKDLINLFFSKSFKTLEEVDEFYNFFKPLKKDDQKALVQVIKKRKLEGYHKHALDKITFLEKKHISNRSKASSIKGLGQLPHSFTYSISNTSNRS